MWTYMNPDELYHHGVLGMKWGVRRYQNKDGSLTSAGRKRYGTVENFQRVQDAKVNSKKRFKMEKANVITQAEIDKINEKSDKQIAKYKSKHGVKSAQQKSISEMSDEELRNRINRIRLENELKSLTPKQTSKGKAIADALKQKAVPSLVDAISDPMSKYIKKEFSKKLGISEKEIESASQKLKRETEDAINRQKKTAAEDWMEKRNKEKEAERAAESDDDVTILEPNNGSNKRESKDSRDDVIDAEFTEIKDDPVTQTGQTYLNYLLALPEPKKK